MNNKEIRQCKQKLLEIIPEFYRMNKKHFDSILENKEFLLLEDIKYALNCINHNKKCKCQTNDDYDIDCCNKCTTFDGIILSTIASEMIECKFTNSIHTCLNKLAAEYGHHESYLSIALNYGRQKMYNIALKYYFKALENNVPDVYIFIALTYDKMKDIYNALKYYKLSVDHDKNDIYGIKSNNRIENRIYDLIINNDQSDLFSIYHNYLSYNNKYKILNEPNLCKNTKHKIEMILLEHYEESQNNNKISLHSHYAFCEKKCMLQSILHYEIIIPDTIINIIVSY